jgi:spermidine/putrescine transport system substrate-binding protein
VLNNFPDWYKEQTGEEVEVLYQTFDINESMLTQIEVAEEDYDVICPSEYIIERMLRKGLLLKIDKNFGKTPDYTKLVSPFAIEKFQQMAPDSTVCVADYTVGYMWGTTGVLYNTALVNESDIRSLGDLLDPKFSGKIFMKDAFRDVYTALLIALNKDAIDAGEKDIRSLSFDASEESIKLVEEYLISFRESIGGWEADFGKEQMTKELAWLNMSWSGDAQWAIDEASEVGVELEYAVPSSGSVAWFDGWVIPKYAKNIKAARYFINFLCMPENAIRNMDYIGYVSVIGGDEVLESMSDAENYDPIDVSYFFGENGKEAYINPIMYPDSSIIDRCGMMHDVGTEELLKMWSRVKGANASAFTYVIIGLVLGGLILAVILKYSRKRRVTHKHKRRK